MFCGDYLWWKRNNPNFLRRSKGSLRHTWSLGTLGEGSRWDVRACPAAATAAASLGKLRTLIPKYSQDNKLKISRVEIHLSQKVGRVLLSRKNTAEFFFIFGHVICRPYFCAKYKHIKFLLMGSPCCYPTLLGLLVIFVDDVAREFHIVLSSD